MPSPTTSLFWIALVATLAPLVAGLVPRRLVPEVVLLLVLGTAIGPYGWGLAADSEGIDLLSELGLAMLFLLAGYEIEPKELAGSAGRRALITWIGCLALAFALTGLLGLTDLLDTQVAVAIALTSTALGTLLPILKDNGLLTSRVGAAVLRHGAYGELGPIVAIAVLLGSRSPAGSVVVLAAFAAFVALLAVPSARLRHGSSRLRDMIRHGAETTGQTPIRLTMLLLITLIAVAAAFDLDIVLAAFAAGFLLRLALPDGEEQLETKIEGIAFGLLVPIFFVVSGMAIDPRAIADNPAGFALILVLILVARGLPVFLTSHLWHPRSEEALGARGSAAVALFSATGLPIIVAVTSVSVSAGEMSTENASILVGAGTVTVLLMPMLATLLTTRATAAQA